MADPKANLLTFTIELNRDGNIEFNLSCVDTIGMEHTLRQLGDPNYGYKIGSVVRKHFRSLEETIKEERA